MFPTDNPHSGSLVFRIKTNGSGTALFSPYLGTAGPMGMIQISNAGNDSIAREASTGGTGGAGSFLISDTSNSSSALETFTGGSFNALYSLFRLNRSARLIRIQNARNGNPALEAVTLQVSLHISIWKTTATTTRPSFPGPTPWRRCDTSRKVS